MQSNQAVLDFLSARRSRPAKLLRAPAPDAVALRPLLTIAARSPDHGKLVPFRFIVLPQTRLRALAPVLTNHLQEADVDPDAIAKERSAYETSPLAVAVVFSPKPSEKIPQIEQQHAAACACYGLLMAALAAGWGANWLTGKGALNHGFLSELGLTAREQLVGFVHIGTTDVTPPERPRPDLDAITEW